MRTLRLALMLALSGVGQAQPKLSRPGEYRGYSTPSYDGYQRTSFHLPMKDGVRLAVDLLRPTRGGAVHEERLPVVWAHHRYNRAFVRHDSLIDYVGGFGRGTEQLLHHGYVLAVVDTRGGGASFGTQQGFFMPAEADDAYDVTEWLAAQPWSSGRIGMMGRSYLGINQLFAAARRPPHLRAIFPEMYVFEFYPFIHPGGVFRDDFFRRWEFLTHQLDNATRFTWGAQRFEGVAPVDGPQGAAQRDSAIADHATNRNMYEMWRGVPFRDRTDPISGRDILQERSPSTYLPQINASQVAVYGLAGWFDAFPRDALLWYANLRVPQKLIIGPWFHGQTQGFDLAIERVRWFDHWLKGIDNGIMREPSLRYFVMGAPAERAWRTARTWPIPGTRAIAWYLRSGPSGTATSPNDGTLTRVPAHDREGRDQRLVDTTATLGTGNRWANAYGGDIGYPNLATNDAKGLTWTSAPLAAPLEVIGHPVVHLWVSADTPDTDVMVHLSRVDSTGHSTYVTEGVLRASMRRQARAPYRTLGLPWPSGRESDRQPLTAETPVELVIDLLPTAQHFPAGTRIRLTVHGADKDTHVQQVHGQPTLTVHRDRTHPSRVVLPIVP